MIHMYGGEKELREAMTKEAHKQLKIDKVQQGYQKRKKAFKAASKPKPSLVPQKGR